MDLILFFIVQETSGFQVYKEGEDNAINLIFFFPSFPDSTHQIKDIEPDHDEAP